MIYQSLIAQAAELRWIDTIIRGGFAGALLVVLWGGHKGWWVYGKDHRKALAECDRWYADLEARHARLREEKDAWMQTALKSSGVAFELAKGKDST